jgi:hypothetical protein
MMIQRNSMMNKKSVTSGLQNISPKVMTMIVLLSMMGILWGRVLLKGTDSPATANAQDQEDIQNDILNAPSTGVEIEAIQLPIVPGRNDRISNDLFGNENWTAFEWNHDQDEINSDVKVDTQNNSIELKHRTRLERIAERLKLEAVICDAQNRPFQAFVDNKVLSVGSTLTVQEGPDQYVLTLEKISKKEVLFAWNEMSIVLKLSETFEF